MQFKVGDLVTVDSDTLRSYVHDHTYNQWATNKLGIVTQIEGHYVEGVNATTILVQVHFESLGNSYWLYAREVILVTP
tara:strand:- start:119 stop:352 length:234 start_codon:yes stop_codon:yes gene_type:complete